MALDPVHQLDRVCGQLLRFASGTNVCLQPYGTEHDHDAAGSYGNAVEWPSWLRDPLTQWWFYDETWVERHGPFKSEQEARKALEKYAADLGFGKGGE